MGTLRSVRLGYQKKSFLGFRFAKPEPAVYAEASVDTNEALEYVAEATAEAHTPVNLPTVGFDAFVEENDVSQDTEELTDLENQAHAQKILLSSDAMRYFIAKVPVVEERSEALDHVIAKARASFPSEDGWVVINLVRMEQMIEEVDAERLGLIARVEPDIEAPANVPVTSGSLAEAIVSGNVIAAYDMISHRPMVALADATADLDALYRYRKGEEVSISEMLKAESVKLSIETLEAVIAALTSALDGTYTDEESAVKMAIMKAIKAISN